MEDEAFADQACSWLDPNAIGDALLVRQQDPEWANTPSEWAWRSAHFESAADVGLDHLLRRFLKGFRIPAGYVRLLRSISIPEISPAVWQWLEDLRFSGELVLTDFPPNAEAGTVAIIRERNAVVRILHAPLSFLCNIVSRYAETWLPLAGAGPVFPRPSLEHSGTGEFVVYLESVIASSVLNPEAAAVAIAPAKPTQILDYRSYSVAGPYPSTPEELAVLRDMAKSFASRWSVIGDPR